MKKLAQVLIWFIGIIVVGLFVLFIWWLLWLNHVEVTEVGVAYDSVSGNITLQTQPGWYNTSPFTRVTHLSLLPMQVSIPSDARIINVKLVKLRPEGAVEFVKRQGFSWTLHDRQENIMMGYAFCGQKFGFLEIQEQASMSDTNLPAK